MFLKNKYTTWYFTIIDSRKHRIIKEYVESHHIIPKSLGGSDKKENRVNLTYREHFLVHWLLTKMTVGKEKTSMQFAFWKMTTSNKNQNRSFSSLQYTIAKRHCIEANRLVNIGRKYNISEEGMEAKREGGSRGGKSRLGKKLTEEQRKAISNGKKNVPQGPHSQETIEKIRKAKIGINKGIARPDDVKRKISESKKNAPILVCPHCGKEGRHNMKRYHFDKCINLS